MIVRKAPQIQTYVDYQDNLMMLTGPFHATFASNAEWIFFFKIWIFFTVSYMIFVPITCVVLCVQLGPLF